MPIDMHSHIVPESFVTAIAGEVPTLAPTLRGSGREWFFDYPDGRRSGPVPAGMFDIAERLADMDADGVTMQALSVSPTLFGYRLDATANAIAARLHNDSMISLAQEFPERFVVLGSLPLQDVEASLRELARILERPEVVGLQLGTNVAGVALGSEQFAPLWSAINAAGIVVVLHPNEVAGLDRMRDYYLQNFVGNPMESTLAAGSLIFSGTLARNDALRIALLHGGGFLPYQLGRFDHGWRVRAEASAHISAPPSSFLSRFWFDTLTHDELSLRFLHERVGSERLVLGTDYPFDMSPVDPVGQVRRAFAHRPEVIDAVLETTARSLITRTSRQRGD